MHAPMRAADATVFLPTPLHAKSEALAERVFGRVLRPSAEWPRERCRAEADAYVVRIGDFTPADIRASPKLKIIARNGTGYDNIPVETCIERGVVVTNVPGGNAAEVAELTIALALAVLRRVVELNNRIRGGERVPSIDALCPGLLGKTVGLVGMGSIALHAAKLFRAFGCTVIVYSPTSPADRWRGEVDHARVGSLDELLAVADVVSLHCPSTPATEGMIGAREIALMKPSAVLINTSRGALVDEAALAAALKEGRLGGAGLDVMRTEPAFGENLGALRDTNAVILPHLGGSTDECAERGCTVAVEIVVDYLEGRGARNRVA